MTPIIECKNMNQFPDIIFTCKIFILEFLNITEKIEDFKYIYIKKI